MQNAITELRERAAELEQAIVHTIQDDLHFIQTRFGKLFTVVTVKNEAQSLLGRLRFAWHVLLGRELEVVIDHATGIRIFNKFKTVYASLESAEARELFAMKGTEDVLHIDDYPIESSVVGEVADVPPLKPWDGTPLTPVPDDHTHEVARMADEGNPHGDAH